VLAVLEQAAHSGCIWRTVHQATTNCLQKQQQLWSR